MVSTDQRTVHKISMMLKKVKNWDDKIQTQAVNADGAL